MAQADFQGRGPWGTFVITGHEPWAETPGTTADGILFDSSTVPIFAHPADVELVQHRVWNSLIVGVRDMAADGRHTVVKLQQPYGAIAATMAWKCNFDPYEKFALQNAYELLQKPGQFYFDHAAHTLYYFSNGEDLSQASVVAPVSEGLLRIAGSSTDQRVRNLVFTGLTFSYDHWLLKQLADSHGMVGAKPGPGHALSGRRQLAQNPLRWLRSASGHGRTSQLPEHPFRAKPPHAPVQRCRHQLVQRRGR